MSYQAEIEKLNEQLPPVQTPEEVIADLELFCLCPNGSRIPIDAICSEVERDPAGAVLRTVENRLVLVLEAVKGGRLYWHQAFYLSTGTSSDMPGTWFPFSGLMIETSSMGVKNERKKQRDAWFAKAEYSPTPPVLPPPPATRSTVLLGTFKGVFGKSFLPEGNETSKRFGDPSFLFASYKLGGNQFVGHSEALYKTFQGSPLTERDSPLKPCFKDASRFPIAPIPVVNAYIERNEALPYYNLFRHLGVKPIGFSKLSVPIQTATSLNAGRSVTSKPISYGVPSLARYEILNEYLKQLYIDNKLGLVSNEELPAKVQEQSIPVMVAYLKKDADVFLNAAPFELGIRPGDEEFYGGRRKKTRRQTKKRKRTSRKHRL